MTHVCDKTHLGVQGALILSMLCLASLCGAWIMDAKLEELDKATHDVHCVLVGFSKTTDTLKINVMPYGMYDAAYQAHAAVTQQDNDRFVFPNCALLRTAGIVWLDATDIKADLTGWFAFFICLIPVSLLASTAAFCFFTRHIRYNVGGGGGDDNSGTA